MFFLIILAIGITGGFYLALYLQNQIALLAGTAVLFAFLTWLGSGAELLGLLRDWYKETYRKAKLIVEYAPESIPHLYTPQLGFVSLLGEPLNLTRRFIKVGINNNGGRIAKQCKATFQIQSHDDKTRPPSHEPKTLLWENGEVYQDIGINRPEYLFVVLSDSRLGMNDFAKENLFALIGTLETVKMIPFTVIRAQDGFGVGNFIFKLVVVSENGEMVTATFRVVVTTNWQELTMEKIN